MDRQVPPPLVAEVAAGALQPPAADQFRDRGLAGAEETVQIADGDVVGGGDGPRREVRFGQVLLDERVDAQQEDARTLRVGRRGLLVEVMGEGGGHQVDGHRAQPGRVTGGLPGFVRLGGRARCRGPVRRGPGRHIAQELGQQRPDPRPPGQRSAEQAVRPSRSRRQQRAGHMGPHQRRRAPACDPHPQRLRAVVEREVPFAQCRLAAGLRHSQRTPAGEDHAAQLGVRLADQACGAPDDGGREGQLGDADRADLQCPGRRAEEFGRAAGHRHRMVAVAQEVVEAGQPLGRR